MIHQKNLALEIAKRVLHIVFKDMPRTAVHAHLHSRFLRSSVTQDRSTHLIIFKAVGNCSFLTLVLQGYTYHHNLISLLGNMMRHFCCSRVDPDVHTSERMNLSA